MTIGTSRSELDYFVIRRATAADDGALARLAQLDSGCPTTGAGLLAERDGRVIAFVSLTDGHVLADPFVPTADLLSLLCLRATQIRQASGSALLAGRRERHRQGERRSKKAPVVGGAEFLCAEADGVG